MTIRRALFAACALVLVLASLLWIYLPVAPRSALGWVVLVVLGVPVSLLIEWLGEAAMSPRFIDRLSSPMRILVAIPIVLAICAVAWVLVWGVRWVVAAA